jgi:hypothetical protein
MSRINLKLNRFVATNWIFKAGQTTLYFFKKGLLFPSRCRLPVILFSALVLLHLVAVSAAGQLSIVALEKNRRKVSLPTREVTRILGATRGAAQPITVIPMSLDVGDVLVGNTGAVAVRVRCYSAEVSISGKFRVRVLGSASRECLLYFEGSAGARLNTTASGPTSVVSGDAFHLGTSRTRYEIEIPAKKRRRLLDFLLPSEVTPIAKVYEGEASVMTGSFSGTVKQGQKFVAEDATAHAIERIEPEDYRRAADIYARLDVSQANLATEKEIEAAYLKLLGLHRAVLEEPDDPSKLTALKSAQQELGVPVSDPEVQQPSSTDVTEVTLKPNEKRASVLRVTNDCNVALTFELGNAASFIRLVSPANKPANVVVGPGGQGQWELEYDATGLKPGTYAGEIKISCANCANSGCSYPPKRFRFMLKVL